MSVKEHLLENMTPPLISRRLFRFSFFLFCFVLFFPSAFIIPLPRRCFAFRFSCCRAVPCRVVRFSMMFCFRPENPSFRTSISLNEADDEGQRLDAFAAAQVRCRTNGKTVWNHKNDTSSGDPTRMVAFRVLFFHSWQQ